MESPPKTEADGLSTNMVRFDAPGAVSRKSIAQTEDAFLFLRNPDSVGMRTVINPPPPIPELFIASTLSYLPRKNNDRNDMKIHTRISLRHQCRESTLHPHQLRFRPSSRPSPQDPSKACSPLLPPHDVHVLIQPGFFPMVYDFESALSLLVVLVRALYYHQSQSYDRTNLN